MSDALRVLVVDDHNVVRSGLQLLLDTQDGIDVVGEASSGEGCLRTLDELYAEGATVDVVVMDLMMEGIGGVEATRRVKEEHPDIDVLILTMASDRGYLREAFGAGASGYVLKDAVDVELVDAIRTIGTGGRYLHPSLGAELARAESEAKRGPRTEHGVPLSNREIEVLRLVALGYANKEISEELYISIRTVESHKTHIMEKTGLRTRSELTRFALEAGIDRDGRE